MAMRLAWARLVTEEEWLETVVDMARLHGWLVMHNRPARRRDGRWRTATQGDPGFPDLVLVKPPRILLPELKTESGRLTREERVWLGALRRVPCVEAPVWRPSDRAEVERVLAA